MKNILKISFLVLAFLFTNLGTKASEKDKICPFELISFTAIEIRDSLNNKLIVNLEWQTASEMNTDKFIIEKDTLDVILFLAEDEFHPIGEIVAAGNSTTTRTYNFSDTVKWGAFAYRIKGVDKDSSYSYSDEVLINNWTNVNEQRNSNSGSIIENIYPNPSDGLFNILLNSNYLGFSELTILNAGGEVIKSISLKSSKDLINMDLSDFPSGEYYLNVSRGTFIETKKITIIK